MFTGRFASLFDPGRERLRRYGLAVIAFLLLAAGTGYYVRGELRARRYGALDPGILVEIPYAELPQGALYITPAREDYRSGDMTVVIPAIEVISAVGSSTRAGDLAELPGLYEFSELPGARNGNVSIAGHRDIHDMVFYSLDQVGEGDFAYLVYQDNVYRYLYKDTRIVAPDEWDVIRAQGFTALTLTTCDPIGTTLRRMVARFEFVDSAPFDGEYPFAESSFPARGMTNEAQQIK